MSIKKSSSRDNLKCPCGSGVKYKNCCKPYRRNGPLIKRMKSEFNDIHTTFYFEINGILNNLCLDSEHLDKLYQAVVDIFTLSERALDDCKAHTYNLKNGVGMSKNDNTWCVDDFDHMFGFYIRQLFVNGGIVRDAICKLSGDLSFNIDFLFGDEDNKKFASKWDKLTAQFTDKDEAERLKKFIFKQKEDWLTDFIKTRNKIEHGNFHIDKIDYQLNKFDKLLPQFPRVLNHHSIDLFHIYPSRFFFLSREIIIFLLAELASKEKFPGGMRGVIVMLKENNLPWGDLNRSKMTYKMTLIEESTGTIHTANFSRSCPKKSSKESIR